MAGTVSCVKTSEYPWRETRSRIIASSSLINFRDPGSRFLVLSKHRSAFLVPTKAKQLASSVLTIKQISRPLKEPGDCYAGTAGLEPVTFCVTGRRSNQLSYAPVFKIFFKNFLPAADFKYFSRSLADILSGSSSVYTTRIFFIVRVVLVAPPLCSASRLTRLLVIPLYNFPLLSCKT